MQLLLGDSVTQDDFHPGRVRHPWWHHSFACMLVSTWADDIDLCSDFLQAKGVQRRRFNRLRARPAPVPPKSCLLARVNRWFPRVSGARASRAIQASRK
eukprot:7397458-Pyramimonas_sp.AAC.1